MFSEQLNQFAIGFAIDGRRFEKNREAPVGFFDNFLLLAVGFNFDRFFHGIGLRLWGVIPNRGCCA